MNTKDQIERYLVLHYKSLLNFDELVFYRMDPVILEIKRDNRILFKIELPNNKALFNKLDLTFKAYYM